MVVGPPTLRASVDTKGDDDEVDEGAILDGSYLNGAVFTIGVSYNHFKIL